MQTHLTRRHFIHTTAFGLAAMSTGRAASPNGNLNHACIGVGGIGAADMRNFLAHAKVRIVAICDVDGDRLEAAGKLVPDARKYTDWRELLAKEGDRIDSVNIAVPDHMHAAITMTALAAKKHVYCQKPLCHDVAECRAVAAAAKAAGVVTRSAPSMRRASAIAWGFNCCAKEPSAKSSGSCCVRIARGRSTNTA
jgi:hypothetical protein